MKIIFERVEGDIYSTENTQYNSVLADRVFVAENVSVRIFGTVREEIVLKPGARVFLHGKLLGDVKNHGGEIYIHPY